MRGFVWLSFAAAGLLGACVVGIDDVESKKTDSGTGGSSGSDASAGGSQTGGSGGSNTGGANTGGSSTGGTSGNGGSATGGVGGNETGGTGGSGGTGAVGGAVSGGGTGGSVNSCPLGMVSIASGSTDYCIDSLEVTQADYQKFANGTAPTQTDPCSTNKLQPECPEFNAATFPKRPAVCVDWCDARAYCVAQGKHLCGKIGGGNADPGAYLDASTNEWFRACSAGGVQKLPYGNAYTSGKCNDINAPTTTPIDVGTYAQCVGGYPGIFDMSGNVREWDASCNVNGCYARGGSYLDLQDNVACNSAILTTRTAATKDLGFRCCAN